MSLLINRNITIHAICLIIIVLAPLILKFIEWPLLLNLFDTHQESIIKNYETKNFDPDARRAISRAPEACKQELAQFINEHIKRPFNSEFDQIFHPKTWILPEELGCFVLSHRVAKTMALIEIDQGNGYDNTYTKTMCLQACYSYGHTYAAHRAPNMTCHCGDRFEKNLFLPRNNSLDWCKEPDQLLWYRINPNVTRLVEANDDGSLGMSNNSATRIRIAFLLTLNGRSLLQVRRLLKLIYAKHHLYYLHVDKRQQYLFDMLLPLEAKYSNIILVKERLSPIWGGSSLLSLMLKAMQDLNNYGHWDYLINLSESDMPLKSMTKLEQYLSSQPRTTIYLKSHSMTGFKFIKKQGLDQTFYECGHRMWRLGRRQLPAGLIYSGGSDWFVLPRNFCDFISSQRADSTGLVKPLLELFNYTLLPAESFFHTLALNIPKFRKNLVDNNLRVTNWHRKQRNCGCQHREVVDWCGCSPLVYRWPDLGRLKQTNSISWLFFSRKFDPTISSSVIGAIEQQLTETDNLPRLEEAPLDVDTRFWLNAWESSGQRELDGNINELTTEVEGLMQFAFFAKNQARGRELIAAYQNQRQRPSLESLNLYFHQDRFIGLLLKYCQAPDNGCYQLLVERNTSIHLKKFNPMCFSKATQRQLRVVEVNHDFDVNERIFRNNLPLNADSNIVVYHEWIIPLEPAPHSNKVQFRWMDPQGRIIWNQNAKLTANTKLNQTHLYLAHKLDIDKPLDSGIWHLVVWDGLVECLNYQFVVFNQSSFEHKTIKQEQFDRFYTVTKVCSNGHASTHIERDCDQVEWSLDAQSRKLKSYDLT